MVTLELYLSEVEIGRKLDCLWRLRQWAFCIRAVSIEQNLIESQISPTLQAYIFSQCDQMLFLHRYHSTWSLMKIKMVNNKRLVLFDEVQPFTIPVWSEFTISVTTFSN